MNTVDRQWTDWLNPIVVRELRQGLRERMFVGGYLTLLIGLGFVTFYKLLSSRMTFNVQPLVSESLWGLFLLVLPCRAYFSVSIIHEVKQGTFENMIISNMGIRKILYGKWISQVSQSLVIAMVFFPFLTVQYWEGEDVTILLEQLCTVFLWGGMLMGVSMAISAMTFVIMRFGCLVILAFTAFAGVSSAWGAEKTLASWIGYSFVSALICFFAVPFLVFELIIPSMSIVDAGPFRRRVVVMVMFLLGLCISSYYFVVWFWFFMLLHSMLEPLQSEELKNRSCLYLIRCWFSQERISSLLWMVTAGSLGTFAFEKANEWSGHSRAIETLALFNVFFGWIGLILMPLLLIELFVQRIKIRAFLVIVFNCILIGIFAVIKNNYHKLPYLAYLPGACIFVNNEYPIAKSTVRTELFSDFIVFFLLSLLLLWRKFRPVDEAKLKYDRAIPTTDNI